MTKFYVIEEVEGSGLITPIKARNLNRAYEKAENVDWEGGRFIVLNEQDYFNMCQKGVGC